MKAHPPRAQPKVGPAPSEGAQVTEEVRVTQPHHPFSLRLLAESPHSSQPRSSFPGKECGQIGPGGSWGVVREGYLVLGIGWTGC